MKKQIILLLVIELIVTYFVLSSSCLFREELIRAFSAWQANPTPETLAILEREKWINQLYFAAIFSIVFGLLASATLFLERIWRRRNPTEV